MLYFKQNFSLSKKSKIPINLENEGLLRAPFLFEYLSYRMAYYENMKCRRNLQVRCVKK